MSDGKEVDMVIVNPRKIMSPERSEVDMIFEVVAVKVLRVVVAFSECKIVSSK